MIETSFKNSQNQNFKLYKYRGELLLGYASLLGIVRYVKKKKNTKSLNPKDMSVNRMRVLF